MRDIQCSPRARPPVTWEPMLGGPVPLSTAAAHCQWMDDLRLREKGQKARQLPPLPSPPRSGLLLLLPSTASTAKDQPSPSASAFAWNTARVVSDLHLPSGLAPPSARRPPPCRPVRLLQIPAPPLALAPAAGKPSPGLNLYPRLNHSLTRRPSRRTSALSASQSPLP